ncbi:MAG TPA: hypothetical protein VMA13_01150, partial [Candidatus Saccharimonadales bacterium]|nr:hypothetical protein [Candidatus Saccharimonadales bacterium]
MKKLNRRLYLAVISLTVLSFVGTALAQTNGVTTMSVSAPDNSTNAAPSGTNSTVALPSITVIGNLDLKRYQIAPDLGAATYTIGQNQIQTTGQGDNSSFQQLVLHAPGVVQDEFGEEHVRGDHGDIQYRINGVLLPESLNGFAQEIDPHMINSVTLMTGTLPAQFGDRTAGIFDITTKSGAQLNGNDVDLYGGSYDTIHPSGAFGGTTGNLDYFVTVSYLHSDLGIDNPMDNSDPLHDTTDQEKAFGYFSYLLNDFSRVTLLTSASYADFQIPDTAGLSTNYVDSASTETPDSSTINENQNEQNYYAVLSYQLSQGDFSGQLSAFTRYTDIRFSPDPIQDLLFDGDAASVKNSDFANGAQLDTEYTLNDSHTLRAGALATYDIEKLDTTSSVFASTNQFSPSGVDEELPTTRPTQSSTTPKTIVANSGN